MLKCANYEYGNIIALYLWYGYMVIPYTMKARNIALPPMLVVALMESAEILKTEKH